jgi:hypothetical protein
MATAKKASEEKAKPKKAADKPADKVKKTAAAKPKASTATKKTSKAKTAKAGAPEQRYRMIEVAAYYIAEKNGFAGNAADYWVQAEIEINAKYPK